MTSTTKTGKGKPEYILFLKLRDYEVISKKSELGQGAFGTVMLVKEKNTN